jgi:hypothetical protein
MGGMILDVAEHLKTLEQALLCNSTRRNAEQVSSLLAEQFREFGSSGRVYSKQEVIAALQEEAPVMLSLVNFEMLLLLPDVALVTYQSLKEQDGIPPNMALRSSIWIRQGEAWRMIFHQGTKLPALAQI